MATGSWIATYVRDDGSDTCLLSFYNHCAHWLYMPFKPVSCAVCAPSVIYHYCVIVEMFCIGLYARHTFRKVEPSTAEDVEIPVGDWQVEKAVQTEDGQMTHNKPGLLSQEAWSSHQPVNASNPSHCSNSEDSLCRIEHAPLDGFPFPQVRGQQSGRPKPMERSSAEERGVDLTHTTVKADINYQDSEDVTVVWPTMEDL